MTKYHINGDGDAGKCSATKGQCPFGGEAAHYASAEEARFAYETTQEALANMQDPARGFLPQARREVLTEHFSQTEALLRELQLDAAYTDAEVDQCLVELDAYGVRDQDFVAWIGGSDPASQTDLNAAMGLDVKYFALQPQAWDRKDLMHPRQLAHRVGPYMVSTRPAGGIGARPGEYTSYLETIVWDSRDEYGLPIYEESAERDAAPEIGHQLALAYAQEQVKKIEV